MEDSYNNAITRTTQYRTQFKVAQADPTADIVFGFYLVQRYTKLFFLLGTASSIKFLGELRFDSN